MREYELTYLISDNVPESELNKVTGKVGGYVSSCDGKILKEEIWGRRKLSYPIQKQEFATYVTINFELPAEKAHEFERNILLTSKIVRHLMIVRDFGQEALTLTAEDIAGAAEIKEVVGGEKSFEAIEGETEESKDLMAVRGDAEKIEETAPTLQSESRPGSVGKEIEEPETEAPAEEDAEEAALEAPEEIKTATPKEKKAAAKKSAKKKDSEADRLKKLDEELDDILGEDL